MSEEIKHENAAGHGSFERQDLTPRGIFYFLGTLIAVTILCLFALDGLFHFLDQREKASQPAVNPLLTNVPEDTRRIAPGYPQSVFPSPKLEEDERGQLNGIRLSEEQTLYSYGWVDEKAGTVHIPIERAMDLLVQRGLPVRPQGGSDDSGIDTKPGKPTAAQATGVNKGKKK
jgi:hypothetical protein